MRLWQVVLLALAAAGASGEEEEAVPTAAALIDWDALQHRESRDSYVDAFQQHSYKPQKQQIDYSHSYPVYNAPAPMYGPGKDDQEPAKTELHGSSGHYGVPHYHHHYSVPDAPHHEEHHEPEKGHGGFELTTIIQFLAKIIFIKLLLKKLLLVMTLILVPKIKLLGWLLKKKKKGSSKPSKKPSKPHHSSEEHHDDDDMSLNFFRNSRSMDHLENRVVNAIEKQQQISTKA